MRAQDEQESKTRKKNNQGSRQTRVEDKQEIQGGLKTNEKSNEGSRQTRNPRRTQDKRKIQ